MASSWTDHKPDLVGSNHSTVDVNVKHKNTTNTPSTENLEAFLSLTMRKQSISSIPGIQSVGEWELSLGKLGCAMRRGKEETRRRP